VVGEDECPGVADVDQADVVVDGAGAAVVAFSVRVVPRGTVPEVARGLRDEDVGASEGRDPFALHGDVRSARAAGRSVASWNNTVERAWPQWMPCSRRRSAGGRNGPEDLLYLAHDPVLGLLSIVSPQPS